jgi:hypothetical protein
MGRTIPATPVRRLFPMQGFLSYESDCAPLDHAGVVTGEWLFPGRHSHNLIRTWGQIHGVMAINERAPVVARMAREVHAPVERVWDLIAGIDRWPSWNPAISEAHQGGPLVKGVRFSWKAGPGTIVSTIEDADPPRSIGWSGRTMGIRAHHTWTFVAKGDRTLVTTEESWDGVFVRLFGKYFQKTLERSLALWLDALQATAEHPAPGGK